MDIQKEREAFESWWEGFHNGRQIACDYIEEDNSYSVGYANAQWVAWQAKAQAVHEQVLDAPACVGGGTFQKGVKWSTVIAAAQRHFKYTQNAKKAPSLDIDQVKKLVSGDFVLVPAKNVKYFSNDGENYEIHDTLAEAKHEAECAIEHFSERLADQLCDPREDGNFQDVGYGIVLGTSGYSVDHVVTQEDVENGEYGYEVGTEIMSLFLVEAQEPAND